MGSSAELPSDPCLAPNARSAASSHPARKLRELRRSRCFTCRHPPHLSPTRPFARARARGPRKLGSSGCEMMGVGQQALKALGHSRPLAAWSSAGTSAPPLGRSNLVGAGPGSGAESAEKTRMRLDGRTCAGRALGAPLRGPVQFAIVRLGRELVSVCPGHCYSPTTAH